MKYSPSNIHEISIGVPPVTIDIRNNDLNTFTNHQFKTLCNEWQFFKDAFLGGINLLNDRYIPRFKREPADKYRSRLKRSHYLNYTEITVNSYKSTIFSAEPDRSKLDKDIVKKYGYDIDFQGSDVSTFVKEMYQWSLVYGFIGVSLDAPPLELPADKLPTQRDVIDQGIRHYFCIEHPMDILDYRFAKNRPKSNRTLEVVALRANDISRVDENGKIVVEPGVKIITPVYVAFYDKRGNLISSYEHKCGFMPFMFVGDQKYDFPVHLTNMKDINYKSFNLLNLSLALDNVLYYNGDPFIKAATNRDIGDIYTASSQFIQVDPSEDVSFIVLPHEVVNNYIVRMDDLKKEIRIMMLKMTSEQKKTNQIESADSKKIDRLEYTEFLKTQTHMMESAENQLWNMIYRLESREWSGPIVRYEREYDLETMLSKLKGFLEGIDKIDTKSVTHKREQAKQYVQIQLGQVVKPAVLNDIMKEIDSADFSDPLEAISGIMDIDDGPSPSSDPEKGTKIDQRYADVENKEEAKQILRNQ